MRATRGPFITALHCRTWRGERLTVSVYEQGPKATGFKTDFDLYFLGRGSPDQPLHQPGLDSKEKRTGRVVFRYQFISEKEAVG